MEVILGLTALSAVVGFALFVIAFVLNPRSPINRVAGLSGFFLGLWALGACFLYFAATQDQAWFWYRVSSAGAFFNPPLIIWFFLCMSGTPFRKRLFLTFPFFLVNSVMLVTNSLYHVWYSGFQLAGHQAVGIPDNVTAWVAFGVVIALYQWAIFYFSSASGFGSQRLVWLSRTLRNAFSVSIAIYVVSLIAEAVFALPHLSGVAFSLGVYTTFYQIYRHGFLNPHFSAKNLDVLLALRYPVAFAEPSGCLIKVSPAFAEMLRLDERSCLGRLLPELFTNSVELERLWPNLPSTKDEVVVKALVPRSTPENFDLILGSSFDEFGDLTGIVVQVLRSATESVLDTEPFKGMDLSAKETHVAVLMLQGLTNKEIAAKAFIAPGTVRVHASNIFRKTGAANRADLIRLLSTPRE